VARCRRRHQRDGPGRRDDGAERRLREPVQPQHRDHALRHCAAGPVGAGLDHPRVRPHGAHARRARVRRSGHRAVRVRQRIRLHAGVRVLRPGVVHRRAVAPARVPGALDPGPPGRAARECRAPPLGVPGRDVARTADAASGRDGFRGHAPRADARRSRARSPSRASRPVTRRSSPRPSGCPCSGGTCRTAASRCRALRG